MCVVVSAFAQISVGKLHLSVYRDPDNSYGAWVRTRIKRRKCKKYNENVQKRQWRPWRMNFKLNESQYGICLTI